MQLEPQLLIRKIRKGDRAAFRQLMETYQDGLFRLAFSFTRNKQDAEDLLQDVFLKVHQSIPTYRGDASPKSWIYRIAVNRCIDWQKQQKRTPVIPMNDDMHDSHFSESRPESNPARMHTNQRIRQQIATAMTQLTPAEQAVFVLRHDNGFSIRHIAETTDRAEGTVKNILFRATQKLRDQLAPIMAQTKQEAL